MNTAVETDSQEIWKDVMGFESHYEISNLGSIRRKAGSYNTPKTRPVKSHIMPNGYVQAQLWMHNKAFHRYVHRLMLEAFVGLCPEGMECCHNDGNRQNNRLDNLRWDTHLSNITDTARHGNRCRGESQGSSKLTEADVLAIRCMIASGTPYDDICARYKISKPHVTRIKQRKVWGWLG